MQVVVKLLLLNRAYGTIKTLLRYDILSLSYTKSQSIKFELRCKFVVEMGFWLYVCGQLYEKLANQIDKIHFCWY